MNPRIKQEPIMNRRFFLKRTGAAGLMFSTGVSPALPEADTSDSLGQAPGPLVSFIKHDYDPVSDQVIYRVLDRRHPSLGQSFTIPNGVSQIIGFRVKVQRLGSPPDLRYRLGRHYGADDVATGLIKSDSVSPFFEYFLGSEFGTRPCSGGQKYFLQLSLAGPTKDDEEGYEVYGTTTEGETPENRDYGAKTPDYAGGEALDGEGRPIANVDFAFEIFFTRDGIAQSNSEGEQRFSFVEELLKGPHAKLHRHAPAQPRPDEVVLDGSWQLVAARAMGEVASTALADFREYLNVAAGLEIYLHLAEPAALQNQSKAVVVGVREQLPRYASGLAHSESFHIEADENSVVVCGFDEQGIMRGLYYLEEMMELRGGPMVSRASVTRSPRLTPRITCAPFLADQELDVPIDPYTDGLLSLISHSGFNAIWLFGNIHDLGQSPIYPELGQDAPQKLARLDALIRRAKKYGMDVYLYLGKNLLPPEFFDKHPEVKGCAWSAGWKGTGFLMCTSVPKARMYLEQATASIFQRAPDLKGIIFIFGNEGFMHDWMARRMECPRCQDRSPFDVVTELIVTLNRGAKAGRPDADVVAWPYSGGTWTVGDPNQMKIIEQLPQDVIFQANFETTYYSQLGTFRDGVGANIYDYSISNLGPSERFQRQADAAAKRNIGVWAKTEFSYSQEFIQTPYIPALQQWVERFQHITAMPHVSGAFMNWQHYGFMPSRCAEIAKWYSWEPLPDMDTLLAGMAARDFGEAAAPKVVEAWSHFTKALRDYPFSAETVLRSPIQKGPSHPFFLAARYQPVNSAGRNFTNNLMWTMPYGVEITAKYFRLMQEEWQRGVAVLVESASLVPPDKKENLDKEVGIAKVLLSCVNTCLNFIAFCEARLSLETGTDRDRRSQILDQMAEIARRELENSQQALPYVKADSRLGYANSGLKETIGVGRGGIFSPQSIEKKMRSLRRLIDTEIPAARSGLRTA